jgi:hypothetical protein
MYGGFNEL